MLRQRGEGVTERVVVEEFGPVVIEATLLPGETPADAKERYDRCMAERRLKKQRAEECLERTKGMGWRRG